MNRFQQWVATLPTVNLRIVVSLSLSIIVVLAAVVLLALRREMQENVLTTVLVFLGAMMGIDAAAFIGKRMTTKVEVMNAAAAIEQGAAVRTTQIETTTRSTETVPGPTGGNGT